MASNKPYTLSGLRGLFLTSGLALAALLLGGCTALAPRESPLNEVTRSSPTALEIYRGRTAAHSEGLKARDVLETESRPRAVGGDDARANPYWSALEPLRQRFARVPNPDLVMVVYPHLARGKYPVPGYVTTFPMYDEVIYALPGEVELGQLHAQARQVEFSKAKAAQAKAQADAATAPAGSYVARRAQEGR